jgi:uncharacterized repeat protein (TIGR01451 family)
MFEKLLGNLSFSPGAVHQLAFYGKRMRQESVVRRTGLVFIVLTFFVQFFAFISPPVSTVAYSDNDMINGGFSTQAEAVSTCRQNVKNYQDVLSNFGISCDDVAAAGPAEYINSTDDSDSLYSMGWISYGQSNPDTHKATDQVSLNLLNVSETLYARKLSSFDSGASSSYKVLRVTSHVTGKSYFLMFACGNLVAHGPPAPIQPCQYNNNILSTDSQCFKPCDYNKNIPASSAKCFKPCQYNNNIPSSSSQCFQPCPVNGESTIPKSSPKCSAPCPYNKNILSNSAKCFKPCQYNKSIPSDSTQCFQPCSYNKSLPATSPQCFKPCKYNSGISSTSASCKPCSAAVSTTDSLACVSVHKAAANLTENIADANNTTAQPGDTILYTLYAQNNGKATIKQFVFQENLSDVMDYADVVDLHGGNIDSNDEVVWPAVDIKANTTALEQITVKVKSSIPATPVGPSDGGHYDGIMTNVYGNTININVPQPAVKTVETVATTVLPNTGPGTGLFAAAAVVIIAGYFFARTRLLAHEATIAVQDNVSGGL